MRAQSMVIMTAVAVWTALLPGAARAEPVTVNPANGHVYEVVPLAGESWSECQRGSRGEHLPGRSRSLGQHHEPRGTGLRRGTGRRPREERLHRPHGPGLGGRLRLDERRGDRLHELGGRGAQQLASTRTAPRCSAAAHRSRPVGRRNDVECDGDASYTAQYFDAYVVEYDGPFDADGDGIPDTAPPTDKDQCKKGGWASFTQPRLPQPGTVRVLGQSPHLTRDSPVSLSRG